MPPATVYVRETCSASAGSSTPAPPPDADNGLGSPTARTCRTLYPNYTQMTASSVGERITRKDASAGQFDVSASPSASASESFGGGAAVTYAAEITEYAVGIKLSNDPNHRADSSGNKIQNDRSVLTPRRADWGVLESDVASGNGGAASWIVAPTFIAEMVGGWTNPLFDWHAVNQEYRDSLFNEYTQISPIWALSMTQVAGLSSSPIAAPVDLTVTDDGGNGISANARMDFIIHGRYETWTKGQKGTDLYVPHAFSSVASPGYALPPSGSVECKWTYNPICYDDIQNVVGAMTSIGGNMASNPILAGFLAAVGAAGNEWMPKDDKNDCSFSCWGKYKSTIDGQVPSSWPSESEQHNYRCYPVFYDIYDNYQYHADTYGHSGYEGQAYSWVKHRYNGWLVGDFRDVGSGGSAAGGGS